MLNIGGAVKRLTVWFLVLNLSLVYLSFGGGVERAKGQADSCKAPNEATFPDSYKIRPDKYKSATWESDFNTESNGTNITINSSNYKFNAGGTKLIDEQAFVKTIVAYRCNTSVSNNLTSRTGNMSNFTDKDANIKNKYTYYFYLMVFPSDPKEFTYLLPAKTAQYNPMPQDRANSIVLSALTVPTGKDSIKTTDGLADINSVVGLYGDLGKGKIKFCYINLHQNKASKTSGDFASQYVFDDGTPDNSTCDKPINNNNVDSVKKFKVIDPTFKTSDSGGITVYTSYFYAVAKVQGDWTWGEGQSNKDSFISNIQSFSVSVDDATGKVTEYKSSDLGELPDPPSGDNTDPNNPEQCLGNDSTFNFFKKGLCAVMTMIIDVAIGVSAWAFGYLQGAINGL